MRSQPQSPPGARRIFITALVAVGGLALGAVLGLIAAVWLGLIPFTC